MSAGPHDTVLAPYAQALGMFVDRIEHGVPVIAADFSDKVLGRPGFLHGGAIAGMLEMAGFAALQAHLAGRGMDVRLKPVNISVEYLRGAGRARTFARGTVLRAGRRMANVRVEAWQADPDKPVASCWMNVLLAPRDPGQVAPDRA